MERLSFGIVHADTRFLHLARYLRNAGMETVVYSTGVPDRENEFSDIRFTTSEDALCSADALILGLPAVKDGIYLNCLGKKPELSSLFSRIGKGKRVYGGICTRYVCDLARDSGVRLYDYYTSEALLYDNALLTAEASLIEVANSMKLPFTGANIVIFGYGRIASLLARRLISLGADVCCICRSRRARAMVLSDGAKCSYFEGCEYYAATADCVVNTVPSAVIGEKFLSAMRPGTPVVELASVPGTDKSLTEKYNINVKSASGLPGKYFPKQAAQVIGDEILSSLQY